MYRSRKGKFFPRNPGKYKGNIHNIVYRSLMELRAMSYFDQEPSFLQWSSEETIIPYFDPATGRRRRYFMDFWVKCKTKTGEIVCYLVEVKPAAQTVPPKQRANGRKDRYIRELATYATNSAKWDAAMQACKSQGWKFLILTEKHLPPR